MGYGEAEQDTPFDNEWSFASSDVFPATYDTSSFFWRVDGGDPFLDAAGYECSEVLRTRQLVEEDLRTAQVDFNQDTDFGSIPGFWKVGVKFSSRDKDSDADGDVYDEFDGDLTLDSVARSAPKDFLAASGTTTSSGRASATGLPKRSLPANARCSSVRTSIALRSRSPPTTRPARTSRPAT